MNFFSGKYDYVHTEDWKTSLIAMEFCTFSNEQWMYIFAERFNCFVVRLKTTSLEICLQLLICCWWTGCCPAACSSLFWICLFQWCTIVQKHFSFFRNQIRIPRTSTLRSEFCYFVQHCQVHPSSNKNLLSNWPMLEWCHENDWWWFLW